MTPQTLIRSQEDLIPLDSLPFRSSAVVTELHAVSEAFRARLTALGFVPGSEVRMLGRAPLGDPYSVRICGYTLSLRREEAHQIWVTVVDRAKSPRVIAERVPATTM